MSEPDGTDSAPKLDYARPIEPDRRISNFDPYLWIATVSFSLLAILAGAFIALLYMADALKVFRNPDDQNKDAAVFLCCGLTLIGPSVLTFRAAVRAWQRRFAGESSRPGRD
jgi:hypothetical protein